MAAVQRCILAGAVALGVTAWPLGALGQDSGASDTGSVSNTSDASTADDASTTDDASYDAVLDRALSAHETGALDEAWALMQQAHALEPNARTLRALGVIAFSRGQLMLAARHLTASLTDERRALSPRLRDSVQSLLEDCSQRFARVELYLEPEAAALRIDGEPAALEESGALWLMPGAYDVEVAAAGFVTRRWRLRANAAGEVQIHVALSAVPEVALAPAGVEPSAQPLRSPALPEVPRTISRRSRRARWTLFGAGAVLGAVGLSTWATARVRLGNVIDECDANGCDAARRNNLYEDESIRPLANAAAVTGAVGAVAILAAASLEIWRWRSERATGQVSVALGSAAPRLAFTFRH